MKVYFNEYRGNIFFASEPMTINEANTRTKTNNLHVSLQVKEHTKFTLVAREGNNGKFLYMCEVTAMQPAGY